MNLLKRLYSWLCARRVKRDRQLLRINEPPRPDSRDSIQNFRRIQHDNRR